MANWQSKNLMRLNEEKCHFMLYGENSNEYSVNIGQVLGKESTEEKLLRVIFDKTLPFQTHIQQLYTKASQSSTHLQEYTLFL